MLAIAAAAWPGGPKHVGAELVALEWSKAPPHSSCWFLAMQLPDGTQIEIGPDRFAVPEVLFNPVGPSTLCTARLCQLADKSMVCRCTNPPSPLHQTSQPMLVLAQSLLSSFGLEAVKKYDGSDLQGLPGAAVHCYLRCRLLAEFPGRRPRRARIACTSSVASWSPSTPGRSHGERGDTALRRGCAAGHVGRHRAHGRRRAAARPARAPGAGDAVVPDESKQVHGQAHACMRANCMRSVYLCMQTCSEVACMHMYTSGPRQLAGGHCQAADVPAHAALPPLSPRLVGVLHSMCGPQWQARSAIAHLTCTEVPQTLATAHTGLGRACAASVTTQGRVSCQQHGAPLRCVDR